MADLDLLYFEQLKKEVQEQFLKDHTPSEAEISQWKGIDIVYFQEDLRKKAKGNISEKSFYNYFKNIPISKLPRIDMLNLLSAYAGYASWYDFKKNHPHISELLLMEAAQLEASPSESEYIHIEEGFIKKEVLSPEKNENKKLILQNSNTDNEEVNQNIPSENIADKKEKKRFFNPSYAWMAILILIGVVSGAIFLITNLFSTKNYAFRFIDADRNTSINDFLDVKILIEGESPILQKVKPNDILTYTTKSKTLAMVISSPYYKTDTIYRNLEHAPTYPQYETIQLKPDDYAIMLNYYSKKSDVDVNKKRERLNRLISDQALIYQVFDNETYGVEIIDKERYITLMTTPTTSLKNLQMINTQMKNGKIVMIKFRITTQNDQ